MTDSYEHTEVVSWGERLVNSFLGVILGVLLFFASFFLLYWNEGRVDLSEVAQTAIEVPATTLSNTTQGKLVATTGTVTASHKLGDDLFLQPGSYIAVDRTVAMYAWVEHTKTETHKNLGGSETKTTLYTYSKEWTDSPEDSNSFKHPAGHRNPGNPAKGQFHYIYRSSDNRNGTYQLLEKTISDQTYRVADAKVGVYRVDANQLKLPSLTGVTLNSQNTQLTGGARLAENTVYLGQGTLASPEVGDLRVSYTALPANTRVTVFGKLEPPDLLAPYFGKKNARLYHLFMGSRDAAIADLHSEHVLFTWIFRAGGFLMMWFGLIFAFQPISAILNFIPWLDSISEGFTALTGFLVAFVLSSVTILVSMLLQHPISLILAIGVTLLSFRILRRLRPAH